MDGQLEHYLIDSIAVSSIRFRISTIIYCHGLRSCFFCDSFDSSFLPCGLR